MGVATTDRGQLHCERDYTVKGLISGQVTGIETSASP
jgi:hypothetical protein